MCRKKAVAKKNRNDIFILIRTRRHATRRDADDDERTKDAMYIEEVCIDGFKSYAKRTVVPGFDPLFNAIHGTEWVWEVKHSRFDLFRARDFKLDARTYS